MGQVTDPVTGLQLRVEFEAAAARELTEGRTFSVGVIDIDRLEMVNRLHGFEVGDLVLKAIAGRMRAVLSGEDTLVRLAGDSLIALFANSDATAAKVTGERLRRCIDDDPLDIDGVQVSMTVSIGLTTHIGGVSDTPVGELVALANAACAEAKNSGRNRIVESSPDDASQILYLNAAGRAEAIRSAIEHSDFVLHSQRIDSLGDLEHPPCIELLIRMRAASDLLIGPDSFIPHAERTHQIHLIDLWVLRQLVEYLDTVPDGPHWFFVNISPASIETPGFVSELTTLLQSGSHARRICFELTETAAVHHLEQVGAFVDHVHSLGARVALDDFGSGTSSLSQLRLLPVDYLKIDGSLTRDVATDDTVRALIVAIASIAKVNNMVTIAEHVEDASEARVLRELGIHLAQGFHISRPVTFEHT